MEESAMKRKAFQPGLICLVLAAVFTFCLSPSAVEAVPNYQHQFTFGSFGTGDGQFIENRSVAIDNNDNILVGDRGPGPFPGDGRIQIFDSNGVFQSSLLKRS